MVQLAHPYITTKNTLALTIWTFVGKVMSLLFNTLSRLVIAFLPRSKQWSSKNTWFELEDLRLIPVLPLISFWPWVVSFFLLKFSTSNKWSWSSFGSALIVRIQFYFFFFTFYILQFIQLDFIPSYLFTPNFSNVNSQCKKKKKKKKKKKDGFLGFIFPLHFCSMILLIYPNS